MPRALLFLFRWVVFLAACIYLWRQWSAVESKVTLEWLRNAAMMQGGIWYSIAAVFSLMFVNWGIEAMKWKRLISPVERIDMARAYKATLAGAGVSLLTPNRTGEFVGRVLFLRPESRIQGAALTVLGSVSQLLVTFLCGTIGLVIYDRAHPLSMGTMVTTDAILIIAVVVSIALAALFISPRLIRRLLDLLPVLRRFDRHFHVLDQQTRGMLIGTMLLSTLRYAVFAAQFLILLGVFEFQVSWIDAIKAVPVIFLITTLVPTMMLTELGVRSGTTVLVLASVGGDATGAALASGALWVINVLLPAAIGSLVLLLARIRTNEVDT